MGWTAVSVGVAVALVAAGAFAGVRSLTRAGRLVPAPQPTLRPVPGFTFYTSSVYGYTMQYPDREWTVVNVAHRPLSPGEVPFVGTPGVDTYNGPERADMVVAAQPANGMTLQEWTAAAIQEVQPDGCHPKSTTALTVDGEPANLVVYRQCFGLYHRWVTLLHGDRAFHIVWLNNPGTEAADRALFDQVLATFTFTA